MAKSWAPSESDHWSAPADNPGMDGWMRLPDISPDEGGELTHGANAMLISLHTNEIIGLWVNDFSGNFEMNGEVVQSKDRRQFFPHSFGAPTFAIGGQTTNEYQYMRLSQFVRQTQLEQMRGFAPFNLRFVMNGGPIRDFARRERGDHADIDLEGYVTQMPSGAERFVKAPPYVFQFAVVKINKFPGLSDIDHISGVGRDITAINSVFTNAPNDRFVSTITSKLPGDKSVEKDHQKPNRNPPVFFPPGSPFGALPTYDPNNPYSPFGGPGT